jgi:hypothetical protein
VEYWVYRETNSNVNCRKVSGNGIVTQYQFKEFKNELLKLYGNELELLDMGSKRINGFNTFYWEHKGLIYDATFLQVNIQTNSSEYLQFTLTGRDSESFGVLKREFWNIISSFKPF